MSKTAFAASFVGIVLASTTARLQEQQPGPTTPSRRRPTDMETSM
jgi:hypothetical protein